MTARLTDRPLPIATRHAPHSRWPLPLSARRRSVRPGARPRGAAAGWPFAALAALLTVALASGCGGGEPGAPPEPKATPKPQRAAKAASSGGPTTPGSDEPVTVALRRRVGQLRAEREAAAGREFYLRLDAGGRRLALMLQGVVLDAYGASALEWAVPQVLFLDRRPAEGWDRALFTAGRLEPERERDRLEVIAPIPAPAAASPAPAAPASPPPAPKSAEELYSVPSPYRIVFAEGVSLEVRSKSGGARNRSIFRRAADAAGLRLADLGSAVGLGKPRERVRLRVTLEAEDAASLYRSLPPDVGLIVAGLSER